MTTTTTLPRLLSVRTVSGLLGLSRWTVVRLINEGELLANRVGNGRGVYRVPEPVVAAYLERTTTAHIENTNEKETEMPKFFGEKISDQESYDIARGGAQHMGDDMLRRTAADPNNSAMQQKAVDDEIASRQGK